MVVGDTIGVFKRMIESTIKTPDFNVRISRNTGGSLGIFILFILCLVGDPKINKIYFDKITAQILSLRYLREVR